MECSKRQNLEEKFEWHALGLIHWRSGWRCYVMSYEDNIDMSLSCSKELNELMEKLEEERKKEKEKKQ